MIQGLDLFNIKDTTTNNENLIKLTADICSFMPKSITIKGLVESFVNSWLKYKKILNIELISPVASKNHQLNYYNNCFFPAILHKIKSSRKVNYLVQVNNRIENFNEYGLTRNLEKYKECQIIELLYTYSFNLEYYFNENNTNIVSYYSCIFSYLPDIVTCTVDNYNEVPLIYKLKLDNVIEKNKLNLIYKNSTNVPSIEKIGAEEHLRSINSINDFAIENFKQDLLFTLNVDLYNFFMEISAGPDANIVDFFANQRPINGK